MSDPKPVRYLATEYAPAIAALHTAFGNVTLTAWDQLVSTVPDPTYLGNMSLEFSSTEHPVGRLPHWAADGGVSMVYTVLLRNSTGHGVNATAGCAGILSAITAGLRLLGVYAADLRDVRARISEASDRQD